MLRSCAAWCAAIQAVPALWPETMLFAQSAEWWNWEWDGRIRGEDVQDALREAADDHKQLLQRAAELDALIWRVQIAGCMDQVRPMLHIIVCLLPKAHCWISTTLMEAAGYSFALAIVE